MAEALRPPTEPKRIEVTMGKRVSGRSHGNAGPVSGDIAESTLNGKAHSVRACETPEFFRLYGCPHK